MRQSPVSRWFGRVILTLVLAALYAPLVMVFVYSFNASRLGAVWTGFSTHWYGELPHRQDLWASLRTSLLVGLLASSLSLVLGTLAAVGLRRWRRGSRQLAGGLLALPLVVPDMILGVSLALFFHALGTRQGLPTVILAHTTFGIAYAFVVAAAAVQDLDESLYAAALDCGATPLQAFRHVILPLLAPSLFVAWLLVFALSFDDFLVTFFTKGVGNDTLPIKIYAQMRFGVRPDTNALFVVLFLVTLFGAVLAASYLRRDGVETTTARPPGKLTRLARRLGVVVGLVLLVLGCVLAPASHQPFSGQTLAVFNWSDYLDPALIPEFERRSGATVLYDNYSSDAELEAKLLAGGGGYDMVFPSDRSLTPLLRKNLLLELDRKLLPNWNNLDPRFLGAPADPTNRYSLPYFWGTLAIGIRRDHVAGPVTDFAVLFDPRYRGRITMLDDAESTVAAALLYRRHSLNSVNDAELTQAERDLLRQKRLVQAYTSDAYKEKLIKGEAWVALGWSGDILQARKENANVASIVPVAGTMKWVDSMAIPRGARNVALAHAFLNFLLEPDIAARNANFLRYATPNRAAWKLLEPAVRDDAAIYPPAQILDRCQWLRDRGPAIRKIERVWQNVRE